MAINERLFALNKNLELLYEQLGSTEKAIIMQVNPLAQTQLKQVIREELLPEIKKYQGEYWQLLAQETNSLITDDFDENEANNMVAEIIQVTDDVIQQNNNDQVIELLTEIKNKLNEPEKSSSAKLITTIPLLPPFVAYELEFDTQGVLQRLFPTFTKLLGKIEREKK